MIPFDVLLVFLTASAALGIAPGPDNLFVLTQSALHGRLAGMVVTAGLCTGLIVHTLAVAIGVAAIFQASELAFTLLKSVGVAYLLYLAWQAFTAGAPGVSNTASLNIGMKNLYLRGAIMNMTNPKVAIFFLAFLPQFASPERGPVAIQIFMLGGLFALTTIVVFGSVAWAGGFLASWLQRSERVHSIMNKMVSVVLVGLAIKLMTSQR